MVASSLTSLLRPALEAAVNAARAGERATPPVPAPAALRRFLSFARLPDPALELARRVLDEDAGFRARVAEGVDEEAVGRAGWLFLARPDGWQAELEALRKQTAAELASAREERAEREAQRRLAGAEAALVRTEATARAATDEAERLRSDLAAERAATADLTAAVEALRAELAAALEERSSAIRGLKGAEAQAQQRAAELRAARHELRMAQAELTGGASSPPEQAPPPPAEPAPAERPAPDLDRAALSGAVAAAAGAAEQLSAALAAASKLLADGTIPAPPDAPARRREAHRHARVRRRPLALPPAVFDDSPEAAAHLVRAPGALVLVDGYNVSNVPWHGLAPAEQRSRLLAACAELHARCGTELEVVFDGVGDRGEPTGRSLLRADVRYRFTEAGVEADDELLARVDDEPSNRPVVVVSSDRRVIDGARARGANVIVSPAFVAALRR